MKWTGILCGALIAALSGCTTVGNIPAAGEPAGATTATPPPAVEMPAEAPAEMPSEADCTPPPSDTDKLLTYFEHVKKLDGPKATHELGLAKTAFTRTHGDYDRIRVAMLYTLSDTGFSDAARALELLDPVVKKPGASLHALALMLASYVRQQVRLGAAAKGLQQKLDALKSLDKTLIERDAGKSQHK